MGSGKVKKKNTEKEIKRRRNFSLY